MEVYISEPAENLHPKEAIISIYDIVGYGATQNFMVSFCLLQMMYETVFR